MNSEPMKLFPRLECKYIKTNEAPNRQISFLCKILPNPMVVIDDNKTKKPVVEICFEHQNLQQTNQFLIFYLSNFPDKNQNI